MSIMVWWIWSINYNALWSWRLWRSEIDIFNFIHWYHNCVVLVLTGIFDHNTEILSLLWHSFSAAVKLFQNSVYVIYGLHPKPVMCIAMHSLVWCEVLQVYLQVSFHFVTSGISATDGCIRKCKSFLITKCQNWEKVLQYESDEPS